MSEKVYRTVSELQWPVLSLFASLPEGQYLPLERAAEIDQRPLGSLYHRAWIGYHAGRGFYCTRTGAAAHARYLAEVRKRGDKTRPLSHYFDPVAYQFVKPERKLKIVHRSRKPNQHKRGAA